MYWKQYEKCIEIAKERGDSYGDVKNNFEDISSILYTNFGLKLTPSQIVEVMICTKIAREKYKHKEDNTLDVMNYYAIREELK